jgi:phage terminase small subunit
MPRTVKTDKHLHPGQPAKPNNLSERASEAWDRIARELTESNIRLTSAHRTVLSMASTLAADIEDAWEAIKVDGPYIAGKAGLVAHPATKRLDALRRDYIKVLAMLGLRTAVPAKDDDKEETLDELLEG